MRSCPRGTSLFVVSLLISYQEADIPQSYERNDPEAGLASPPHGVRRLPAQEPAPQPAAVDRRDAARARGRDVVRALRGADGTLRGARPRRGAARAPCFRL